LERAGGGGGEELEGATEGSRVALLERVVLDEESRVLLVDEFESAFRFVSLGADTPQSVLPLEAVFGRSLQWSACGGFESGSVAPLLAGVLLEGGVACCAVAAALLSRPRARIRVTRFMS